MWKQRLTFQRRNLLQAEIERNKPDVILLSAYLSHRKPVEFIAGIAARLGVPVLLGGPAFTLPGAAEDWARITGVSAVFSGEAEFAIVDLVRALISGVSVYSYPGIFVHSEKTFQIGCGSILEPLSELNELPIPDLSDFPWKLYPHRIVPLMASRGCGWGRCTFCSDVITANGRTFRGRGLEHVLHEIEMQSKRYPGESTSDVDLTTQFLDRNAEYLDRVNLCRFKPIPGNAVRVFPETSFVDDAVAAIDFDLQAIKPQSEREALAKQHYHHLREIGERQLKALIESVACLQQKDSSRH